MAICIKTEKLKKYHSTIKSYCKNIEINSDKVSGTYSVKSIRKYKYYTEVDIELNAKIYVRFMRKLDWFSTTELLKSRASLIKINRILRRSIYPEIRSYLETFHVELGGTYSIKKIKHV